MSWAHTQLEEGLSRSDLIRSLLWLPRSKCPFSKTNQTGKSQSIDAPIAFCPSSCFVQQHQQLHSVCAYDPCTHRPTLSDVVESKEVLCLSYHFWPGVCNSLRWKAVKTEIALVQQVSNVSGIQDRWVQLSVIRQLLIHWSWVNETGGLSEIGIQSDANATVNLTEVTHPIGAQQHTKGKLTNEYRFNFVMHCARTINVGEYARLRTQLPTGDWLFYNLLGQRTYRLPGTDSMDSGFPKVCSRRNCVTCPVLLQTCFGLTVHER